MPLPPMNHILQGGRTVRLLPQGVPADASGNWEPGDNPLGVNLDTIEYIFSDSTAIVRERFDCGPGGSGRRQWLLTRRMLGTVSDVELSQILTAHAQWREAITAQLQQKTADEDQNKRYIRGLLTRHIKQTAQDGEVWSCEPTEIIHLLRQRDFVDDTLVSWSREELERAAILDLDFHDASAPKPPLETVESLARDLSPTPYCWWTTQGGGLHAYFVPTEHCTAEELAAGALAQLSIEPEVVYHRGSVEIKAGTRHPSVPQRGLRCGPIHETIPTEDFACLARLTGSGVSEKELTDFLADQKWTLGESLDHSHCLIDPDHASSSATPVFIGEGGVFCHSCAARLGVGMTPWIAVMARFGVLGAGEHRLNCIAQAAKNLVPWAQAEYYFATLMPQIQPPIRHLLYRALVKKTLADPNDPRIPLVFDSEWRFVRSDTGEWLHAATLKTAKGIGRPDMLALPSCLDVGIDSKGEVKLVPRKSAIACHQSDGFVEGWRPIAPHPFVPIFWQHNNLLEVRSDDKGTTIGYEPVLCRPKVGAEGRGVGYRAASARIPKTEAEARIQARWPGINLTYMTAIVVALGHGESGVGRVPMLWAQGPSGSAKTTTLRIVASMMGEDTINLSSAGEDRLDQLYGEALSRTRFILFDDFAKQEEHHQTLSTFFLRVNRLHSAHKLYHGMNHQRVKAPIFLTEWAMPESFVADRQFARRVHMIQLNTVVKGWDETRANLEDWWREDDEIREATESWFSYIVDEFFDVQRQISWPVAMRMLGIPAVNELNRDETSTAGVRSLVCLLAYEIIRASVTSPLSDPHLASVVGNGAVLAQPGATQPVGQVVQRLLDTRGAPKWHWFNLQRIVADHAEALKVALGLKCSAEIQGKMNGNSLYLRVVEVSPGRHSKRFNQRLCEEWPLPDEMAKKITHPVFDDGSHDIPPDDHTPPPSGPPPPSTPPAEEPPIIPGSRLPRPLQALLAARRAAKGSAA